MNSQPIRPLVLRWDEVREAELVPGEIVVEYRRGFNTLRGDLYALTPTGRVRLPVEVEGEDVEALRRDAAAELRLLAERLLAGEGR